MTTIRSAVLIVNTQSRSGKEQFDRVREAFADAPFSIDARAVDDPDKLKATMRGAIATKPDLIILGGGDGTISCLSGALAGTGIALGVLPLGTANSFARSLALPLEVEEAVAAIIGGHRRTIDLVQLADVRFANMAALGLSPQIADSIPDWLKRYFGRAGYLAWAALCFARFRPFRLSIEHDGRVQRFPAVEVRIANGSFHGGTQVVEKARVDSGTLIVQAVRGPARSRLLRNWAYKLIRRPAPADDEVSVRAASVRIETDPPLPISIDGEVLARTPVYIRVLPGAIDVIVPG